MTRTYVRTRDSKPYPSPQTEREELQNILWGMGTAIPGSSITDPNSPIYVEMSELRDLVQWQAEKIAKEPEFQRGHMTEEARDGFREYLRWRDRRDMGTLSFRIPGVPGQDG
jgi:hypothetical protein